MVSAVIARTGRTDEGADLLELVNHARASRGLHHLRPNAMLTRDAHYRAADMARRDYFAHAGWLHALRRVGYWRLSRAVGENIAKGQCTVVEVFNDWMNSPEHRANILSARYREVGLAHCADIWAQEFGARR